MPTILKPGQRKLLRFLLALALFVVANSAYLYVAGRGAELTTFYQLMLISHLVGGLLLLVVMTVFFLWHFNRVRKLFHFAAVSSGIGLTLSAYLLFASGIYILYEANAREHYWVFLSHRGLAIFAVLAYGVHRWVSHFRPQRGTVVRGAVAFTVLSAVLVAAHFATLPPPREAPVVPERPRDPFIPFEPTNYPEASATFFPTNVTTDSGGTIDKRIITRNEYPEPEVLKEDMEKFGFLERDPVGVQTCRRCHPDIVEQWADSMHRFSSMQNPWYREAFMKLRETHGNQKSQWCAGCHDPAILLPGAVMEEIDITAPTSQAGLACLYCHQIDRTHGLEGNANFNVADLKPSPYLGDEASTGWKRFLADQMTKAKPRAHKERFLKPMHRTSEFCLSCHKVSLDRPINDYKYLRGQDEYDKWHDSGVALNAARTFYLPPKARSCQDCHMPKEPAIHGDVAAKNGMVKSHRFYGPNTAMSHIRGDFEHLERIEKFRAGNLIVDLFAVQHGDGRIERGLDPARPTLQAGDEVIFEVVVRNKGVGHTFPGGTNDSNESWIEFVVTDDDGNVVFHSGAMGKDRYVDPAAHFYRTVMVRHDGTWATERQAHLFHVPALNRVIGPGTADVARYGVKIPESLAGKRLHVRAALRWRKFSRAFHEFVFNRPGVVVPKLPHLEGQKIPDLPIDTLGEDAVTLDVAAARKHAEPVTDNTTWMRFNDHGIASFLQGAFDVAEGSWGEVARLQPKKVDGWRNLARRWIASGQPERAREYLERVDELEPTDPQRPYFWGRYFARMEDFAAAERAFEASLEVFPNDRDGWRRLGTVRYKQHRYEDALSAYLKVLEIDPEDLEAHKRRVDIYRHLGDEASAAEALKAFEKYRVDDEREAVAREFLKKHEEVNHDAQKRHVHR